MCFNSNKYYFLLAIIFLLPVRGISQGVGRAILNVTFDEGVANPGPALPENKTSYTYTQDSCPAPGFYTISNSLYRCPRTRIGRSIDNTPQSSSGYMMLVNGLPANTSKIVYVDTIKQALCPGTRYQFSAYILNTAIPANCASGNDHFPSFTFSVETPGGQVIQAANTGPMGYDYNMDRTPRFNFRKVAFTMPAGVSYLVLKIRNEASGFPVCPYSFAMDDIQLSSIGPLATIEFEGAVGPVLVKSVCYQHNKTLSLSGSVGAYYSNTSLQWQQTTDDGITWMDIPGAVTASYSRVFSIADTFLFRLTAAEADNIQNPNCRIVSNTLKIQVDGIPANFNTSNNSPVCSGSPLQFNATGGARYVWTGPNNFYDDIAFPHIAYASLRDSGMYYAEVITLGGCRARDSTYARVVGTDVHAGPDTAVCKGNAVQLSVNAGLRYSWSPANGLSAVTINNPLATPDASTLYTVNVTDNDGCSDTAQVMVKLINHVAVKARIAGLHYICRPYDSVVLKDVSSGEITNWRWDFGNGQTADTAVAPTQYYSIPVNENNYTITLSIADSFGCTDAVHHQLKAVNNCYIAVPTAFTPNGDGLNDYLYPLNAYKATLLTFKVYNRKGILVFETKDWTKKWDGNFQGNPLDAGTYIWILQYNDALNKRISLKGSTVLLR